MAQFPHIRIFPKGAQGTEDTSDRSNSEIAKGVANKGSSKVLDTYIRRLFDDVVSTELGISSGLTDESITFDVKELLTALPINEAGKFNLKDLVQTVLELSKSYREVGETLPVQAVSEANNKEHSSTAETSPRWGKRNKGEYKGNKSAFQFIADFHPDLRTTGGLNARDHSLYQAYRSALKERREALEQGKPLEPLPEGFKPLLDKDTEIATRERPSPEQRRAARRVLAEDQRTRERQKDRERQI